MRVHGNSVLAVPLFFAVGHVATGAATTEDTEESSCLLQQRRSLQSSADESFAKFYPSPLNVRDDEVQMENNVMDKRTEMATIQSMDYGITIGRVIHWGGIAAAFAFLAALVLYEILGQFMPGKFLSVHAQLKLYRLAVPHAIAVTCCVSLTFLHGKHWLFDNYEGAAAVLTVMLVVEMGLLDALVVKGVMRLVGTLFGVFQAVLMCAMLTKADKEDHFWITLLAVFAFTAINGYCKKAYPKYSYCFVVSAITSVLVLFGFKDHGWNKAFSRAFSIFIGIVFAVIGEVVAAILEDFGSKHYNSLSDHTGLKTSIMSTNAILSQVLSLVDVAFIRIEVHAMKDVNDNFRPSGRKFHDAATRLFNLDGNPHMEDLLKLIKSKGFMHEVDSGAQIMTLQGRVQSAFSSNELFRSFGHMKALPDIPKATRLLQSVFARVTVLLQCPSINSTMWTDFFREFERIRVGFQSLEGPLDHMLQAIAERLGNPDAGARTAYLAVQEILEKVSVIESNLINMRDQLDLMSEDDTISASQKKERKQSSQTVHMTEEEELQHFGFILEGLILLHKDLIAYAVEVWKIAGRPEDDPQMELKLENLRRTKPKELQKGDRNKY